MKSAVVLALSSTTLAVPFVDAMFGANNEARHVPHPDDMPGYHPINTGSGIGLPFPAPTGAIPTPSGGMHILPHPHGHKSLAINYQLAATALPKEKRQGYSAELPSFTLLPSDSPPIVPASTADAGLPYSTGDEPAVPLPTEEPVTGVPTEEPGLPYPTPTEEPAIPVPTEEPGLPTGEPEFPYPTPSEPAIPLPTEEPGLPVPTEESELPIPTVEPSLPAEPSIPVPVPTGGSPYQTDSPDAPFPTGGVPAPTGGFPAPTGGLPAPGLPTTLQTLTRGPQPTAAPEYPGYGGGEEAGEGQDGYGSGSEDGGFWSWIGGLFGGKSDTSA